MRLIDLGAGWALVKRPEVEALDLGVVRKHLRVKLTDEDDLIASYMQAARARFERATGLYPLATQLELAVDACPPGSEPLELDRGPLLSVESIATFDRVGTRTDLSVADFVIDTRRARIAPAAGQRWPSGLRSTQGLVINLTVGMATESQAIEPDLARTLLELTAWYFRRTGTEPPDSLLASWQGVSLA